MLNICYCYRVKMFIVFL